MSETTIEWCRWTHNEAEGCNEVSPGCRKCFAKRRNARFNHGVAVNWGPPLAPRGVHGLFEWRREALQGCQDLAALRVQHEALQDIVTAVDGPDGTCASTLGIAQARRATADGIQAALSHAA